MPHLNLGELHEGSEHPETIVLELTDEEIVKFRVGQKIEITIRGSVGLLSVPPQGSSEEEPAELGVRITDRKIKSFNEFAELAEDEDEED